MLLHLEYYSAIKKNEFMKFLGKWLYLEGIILSEVTQSQEKPCLKKQKKKRKKPKQQQK
jgi:hypothetical protein